jgi:hypothetical protein
MARRTARASGDAGAHVAVLSDGYDSELEALTATYQPARHGWSAEDDARVARYAGRVGWSDLARILRRTPAAVRARARELRQRGQ